MKAFILGMGVMALIFSVCLNVYFYRTSFEGGYSRESQKLMAALVEGVEGVE